MSLRDGMRWEPESSQNVKKTWSLSLGPPRLVEGKKWSPHAPAPPQTSMRDGVRLLGVGLGNDPQG